MAKRINYILDRFEVALVKLQAGETSLDFLSVLKGAVDYSVRLYPDIGRLQFQRQLEQGLCDGVVPQTEEVKVEGGKSQAGSINS